MSVKEAKLSSDPRHLDWVANFKKTEHQLGSCHYASDKLAKEFPELRVVRGYAHVLHTEYASPRTHWWCETADGLVVDATDDQWAPGIVVGYEEYDTQIHGPEPVGKCMDCGALIFPEEDGSYWDSSFCNEECSEATRIYMKVPKERWKIGSKT